MGLFRPGYDADFVITSLKDLDELACIGEDAEAGFKALDEKYDFMIKSTWVLGKEAVINNHGKKGARKG